MKVLTLPNIFFLLYEIWFVFSCILINWQIRSCVIYDRDSCKCHNQTTCRETVISKNLCRFHFWCIKKPGFHVWYNICKCSHSCQAKVNLFVGSNPRYLQHETQVFTTGLLRLGWLVWAKNCIFFQCCFLYITLI